MPKVTLDRCQVYASSPTSDAEVDFYFSLFTDSEVDPLGVIQGLLAAPHVRRHMHLLIFGTGISMRMILCAGCTRYFDSSQPIGQPVDE